MMALDRDALLCDLAETYGIFDLRALPASVLATLCVGLRDDSRIKMRLSGIKAEKNDILLAAAVDRLSLLVWAQTEDGRNGINRPKMMLDVLLGEDQEDSPVQTFESAEEFEAEWERITGVSHGQK